MDELEKRTKKSWYNSLALPIVGFMLGTFVFIDDPSDKTLVICSIVLWICSAASFYIYFQDKRWREEREEAAQLAREKIDKFNQAGKEHKWTLPAEKFYQQCSNAFITQISNEFEFGKAKAIVEQLVKDDCPEADLDCFQEYFTKDSLQNYMRQGKPLAEKTAQRKLEESKRVLPANATKEEAKFIRRADALSVKTGCNKRVTMLTDLLEDCDQRLKELHDGEEAMLQLATIYAGMQKKEKNWASIGGFAEGLAGPAAGIMAASDAMRDNYEIRKYNEEMRQTSIDIIKGAHMSNITDQYKLKKERGNIQQQIEEAKTKVTLTNPTAQQIWNHFSVGDARVVKNESGVLECSVSVRQEEPFHLDVPNGVSMVVDGTLEGDIWIEGMYVGSVDFPLPLYGIPCNTSSEVTVDGMCGKSMEYIGKYSLKLRAAQNLWIMEA